MENYDGETTTTNNTVNGEEEEEEEEEDMMYSSNKPKPKPRTVEDASKSLYAAVSSLLSPIFFPDSDSSSSSFFHRTKASFRDNLPHLRQASTATASDLLCWARRGSSFRLLLFISVGTITLLTLTGVLVFLLFLAAATVNAIILSLFMSLAAAGGFLAIFFACVAGIYIGALSIAVVVISFVTISAIITTLIVTGWIGFFWILWLVVKKSSRFAKQSVTVTGSALSAYASGRHGRQPDLHQD